MEELNIHEKDNFTVKTFLHFNEKQIRSMKGLLTTVKEKFILWND